MRHHNRGFTLTEALVLGGVIVVVIILVLPALNYGHHGPRRQMKNSTQVRGIHQGHILFSQGNMGYYAGLDKNGNLEAAITTVPDKTYGAAQRLGSLSMAILLNGNYFVPGYLIHPAEPNPKIVALATYDLVTRDNYSYAYSKATDATTDYGRHKEWRDNTNTYAPVLSDRAMKGVTEVGSNEEVQPNVQRSLYTKTDGDWRGSVVFGDNNTQFLTSSTVAKTHFDTVTNTDDNLFTTTGANDAFQVRD